MAGEWLKFECSLPEKPETLAITVAMGWDDPDLTVGKLMRLFRWFDQQTINGNAHGVTAALLDRLLGVTGFVQAVANTGWLVISSDGLTLHNFDKHNGATAKSRAQTAKRVANHRASGPDDPSRNAETVTSPLAREEKKREDEEIQGDPATRADATSPSTSGTVIDLLGDTAPSMPACPIKHLVGLFARKVPELPRPRYELWKDGAGADAMRQRWKWLLTEHREDGSRYATTREEGIDWFGRFFDTVAESDFLTGRNGKWSNCDLSWLMKFENFMKVVQGNFNRERAAA